MKAIILCAVLNKRLKEFTKKIPLCLVDINGKSILERQIELLSKVGITEYIFVTGYKSKVLEAFLKRKYKKMSYQIIGDKTYAKNNSGYWLTIALEKFVPEDFVLMNSDLIFEEKLLTDLLRCKDSVAVNEDKYIGLLKLKNYIGEVYIGLTEHIRKDERFEKALAEIIKETAIVKLDASSYKYTEIDYPCDIEKAKETFKGEVNEPNNSNLY